MINKQYVNLMRERGYYLNAWTVNKSSYKKKFYQQYKIGLITDCPDLNESCKHDASNMMDEVKIE